MSKSPADEDRLDHDQTDELPVLLDAADVDADDDVSATAERTGEHTTHLVELPTHEERTVRELESELDQRFQQIASLERDLARLSARWLDMERYLTEKDAVIRDLNRALAKARVESSERRAIEQRLAAELEDREAQFNKLLDELDKLRQDSAASARAAEEQRASRHAAVEALALARLELAQHSSPNNEADEIRALREELATLTVYIDNRHASWAAAEARGAEQQQRIGELERELAQRAERLQRAEQLAERANARAIGLREELVTQSRRAESLAAELEQYRSYPVAHRAAITKLEAELADAWQLNEKLRQDLGDARAALAGMDDGGALVPQIHDDHAKAGRRTVSDVAPISRVEPERRPVGPSAVAETASSGATSERTAGDKDSHPPARDDPTTSAPTELVSRRHTGPGQVDSPAQILEAAFSHRALSESAIEMANTPTLLCLTSGAPRRYALTKRVTTIGRSAHCDIQIVTHFVSREHARISVKQAGNVTIEDLDSTNGIFVNSVRVEQQELRHGDLVTVGETQFRFLESVAH
jgi:hypothetical protein